MHHGGVIYFLQLVLAFPICISNYEIDRMHPHVVRSTPRLTKRSLETNPEISSSYWIQNGHQTVRERVQRRLNQNVAKNVILFLGDGMSIPTIAAARVFLGGEGKDMAFDKFPYSGLAKTYCVDMQVADSACSATAYLSGIKANYGTIGVDGNVELDNCAAMMNQTTHAQSIARRFQLKKRRTGLVTTARVTHASPAGVYAHTAQRDWESDSDVVSSNYDSLSCPDIAQQLVFGETGTKLNVVLGGGRTNFLPQGVLDEENNPGRRLDNENLIEKWLEGKAGLGKTAKYVWNRDQLQEVQYNETEYLLGLFNDGHLSYNLKRNVQQEPSLAEMTEAAIRLLRESPEGYFLFVEGARIDMAHHLAKAKTALDETLEFSKAVQVAVDLTNDEDTLIVVTSDHAHTMTFSGYPERGNDILGFAGQADDNLPYSTLSYANGPGYKIIEGRRPELVKEDMLDDDFQFPATAPIVEETHGGDDVGVFARGPWAHLFTGVMEQHVIPHLMGFASCVSDDINACDFGTKEWGCQSLLLTADATIKPSR